MFNRSAISPEVLIPILFLAFLVEGLVEYLARPFINPSPRAFLDTPSLDPPAPESPPNPPVDW